MPEIFCPDCGKRLFHENEDTLKVMQTICSKFCTNQKGEPHSYMHREKEGQASIDEERSVDDDGKPVLKR